VPVLPNTRALRRELQIFRVRIAGGAHETYRALHEAAYGDLMSATALVMCVTQHGVDECVHVFRRDW
jgi:hypothetical protein